MELVRFRRNYGRNILIRMVTLAILMIATLLWKLDFIIDVYFKNQLTATGLIINGAILALFLMGIARMIYNLLGYMREEEALVLFVENLDLSARNPLHSVPENAMIVARFRTMQDLYKKRVPINHGALAATLLAAESTRNALPKFINNILILTGVFGTIIALSIALLGASEMLESVIDTGGMGLVIHGMSTALSTTITAIVCYLYFGYFYLKLTDVQTDLLSAVEQVTTSYLLPRFQVQTESILYEFSGLVRSCSVLVNRWASSFFSWALVWACWAN